MKGSKSLNLVAILLVLLLLLAACTKDTGGNTANPMNYLKAEVLKESIESGSNDYIVLDMRKSEDYNNSYIVGSYLEIKDKYER